MNDAAFLWSMMHCGVMDDDVIRTARRKSPRSAGDLDASQRVL